MPETVLQMCNALAADHPRLLVERKRSSVALHYRRAPELAALCLDMLGRALRHQPGLGCCTANACWRSGPQAWTKATPLRPSCAKRRSPAAPRCLPVTMSRTSGFAVVQAHGGMAIKVGEGATRARHRLGSPQAAHAWLKSACMHLAAQTCAEVLP